jgi:hypothetical protein
MEVLAAALAAALLGVAAVYGTFLTFRQRARRHLSRQPDIAWRRNTPAGMVCAVLGYPLEVDLSVTFAYRWRRRAAEPALFDDLAHTLRARVPPVAPAPFPLVRDRILPLIKRIDALPPPDGYRPENLLLRRALDADILVVYAIEGPFQVTYVTAGMAEAWSVDAAAVHALALDNLRARTRHLLAEIGGRQREYIALDGFDAARILVADLIIPEEVADPVIGIPHEHACLIADRSQQAALSTRVEALFRSARAPLTPRLFVPTPLYSRFM